jgi:hypothetical protein
LFANECQLKDQSILVERAVFQKKLFEIKPGGRVRTKSESASNNIDDVAVSCLGNDFAEHLSVKEDNFSKYVLSNKGYADNDGYDEDDSEFGSSDEDLNEKDEPIEYETDDNQSNTSEINMDTNRNRHFYVWKFNNNTRKKEKERNHLIRPNNDSDSECVNESTDYSSSETDSSDQSNYNDQDTDSDNEKELNKPTNNVQKKQPKLNQDDTEIFFNEVIEILERGLKQNLDPENLILEINSSKHANNIQVKIKFR